MFSLRPPLQVLSLLFALVLSALLLSPAGSAQQPKVLAPHRPLARRIEKRLPWSKPAARQSATGGLWMTDGHWKSALYLKSGLRNDPITVKPTLYLSNGQRYPLPPVALEPSGTAVVDIGQALEGVGIAPYATLCGYAEIEYEWPWAAVSGTVKNVDVVNSLIFIFGLQPSVDWRPDHPESFPARLASSFEGLWWKQEKDVSGFIGLSNVTGQPIHASVRLTGQADARVASYETTVSPHGTKMLALDELKGVTDKTGGIYVTHDGPERGLDVNGGLEDQAVGYSANLRIWPQPQPPSASQAQTPETLSISELGLMTGAADPMMNFPYGTVFTPYSLVRNISKQPAEVTPELWWMAGGSPHSAMLSKVTIPPHQTADLNAPTLLAAAGLKDFNGSVNLILNTKAQAAGLVMSSGSVDEKNTYVFEVMPHGVAESAAKELCYWSTANGDDTMVTLWNPADETQDLAFTLFYSGGQYVYPIAMGPRETRTLNVSEILHSSTPDAAGNVIPAGITEGSAEIAGAQGEQEQILVSLDVATYNVRKATCGTVCWECDGAVDASIFLAPFAVAVSGTAKETFYLTYNTGYQYDYSGSASWSSSSPPKATVSSAGVVTGVSAGTFNLGAVIYSFINGVGWYCTDMYFSCPTSNFSGGSQGSSAQPPTVTFSSINYVIVGQTATINATVSPNNAIPISLSISSTAAIVTPPGTFTSSTPVVVKGLTSGGAALNATIANADRSTRNVGSTSFTVVSFQGVLTPTDNFSGRSNVRFGLGETVSLSAGMSPSGVAPGSIGGLQWSIVSGGGSLAAVTTNGTATYTAPSAAGSVVLKLAVVSGPFQGVSQTYTVSIVAPNGAYLVKYSGLRHTLGFISIEFLGHIYLTPTDVSFANLKFAEGSVAAVATGYYASSNGEVHQATAVPVSVGACNTNTGCHAGDDDVDSGDGPPPFSSGDFLWAIPWQYQPPGGALTVFTTANHHETAGADGTATIEKAGAGPFSKKASDPTSGL